MILLTNKADWGKWIRNQDIAWETPDRPKEYPCFAYAIVKSYSFEEEQPVYLYRQDIIDMVAKMERAR